ncbi:hypothetical protein [Okeania sp. SIO2G5]|nr:hypothetical protein [Okeania sp. SIO2G5]
MNGGFGQCHHPTHTGIQALGNPFNLHNSLMGRSPHTMRNTKKY